MATDREIEGTPAEATWAMVTVLIIIVVVLIFCCLMPFYRALEKRTRHWDDLGNDPRWDVENFQFSPTSPQLIRDPKYNRLSVCSTDNGSSLGTSSSGVNRGDSFRNTCVLPRFPDQVEFKLPPSYDDLFSKVPEEEEDGTPPPYSITNTTDTEELIKDKKTEEIAMPALAPQAKKIFKKPLSKSSAPTSTPPVETNSPTTQQETQSVSAAQDKNEQMKAPASSTPTTMNKHSDVDAAKQAQARPATKSVSKTKTIPSSLAKTNAKNVLPTVTQTSSQPPAPPTKKTNSKIITKPTPQAVQGQLTSSQPAPAAPVPPVKKTYKKIKKTVPLEEKYKVLNFSEDFKNH